MEGDAVENPWLFAELVQRKSKVTYHVEAFRSTEHSCTHLKNIVTAKIINNNLQNFSCVCVYTNIYIFKIKSV